jgi:hypothetical protein
MYYTGNIIMGIDIMSDLVGRHVDPMKLAFYENISDQKNVDILYIELSCVNNPAMDTVRDTGIQKVSLISQ